MCKRQMLQQMMQTITQRASRNKVHHMTQSQEPAAAQYSQDDGPLTNNQLEQIKQSVRTKYA